EVRAPLGGALPRLPPRIGASAHRRGHGPGPWLRGLLAAPAQELSDHWGGAHAARHARDVRALLVIGNRGLAHDGGLRDPRPAGDPARVWNAWRPGGPRRERRRRLGAPGPSYRRVSRLLRLLRGRSRQQG